MPGDTSGSPAPPAHVVPISIAGANGIVTSIGAARNHGQRTYQQDALVVISDLGGDPNRYWFSIYDGHGGPFAATHVASRLHDVFLQSMHYKFGEGGAPPPGPSKTLDEAKALELVYATASREDDTYGLDDTGGAGAGPPDDVEDPALPPLPMPTPGEDDSAPPEETMSGGWQSLGADLQVVSMYPVISPPDVDPLLGCFVAAYKRVEDELADKDVVKDGTTATTLFLNGRRLYYANVGDSLAVLGRGQKATSVVLSAMHNAQTNADERKRIVSLGGRLGKDRAGHYRVVEPKSRASIAVTRSLGDLALKRILAPKTLTWQPATGFVDLEEDDQLGIVASDGLWDVVEPPDAVKLCLMAQTAQQAADALIRLACKRGTRDNVSVVVFFLKGKVPAPPLERLKKKHAKSRRIKRDD